MARYLIGNKNDQWNFDAAYNSCQNGDVLEFDAGLNLTLGNILYIDKSITIGGKINQNNEFTNSILGFIKVVNGANVKFLNIVLTAQNRSNNILLVKGSSSASLINVAIDQKDNALIGQEENSYPEICAVENSSIYMESAFIPEKNNFFSKILLIGSTAEIKNSTLNTSIECHRSEININNSRIVKYNTNAISLHNTVGNIERSHIEGGDIDKSFPCIFMNRSNLTMLENTVYQKNYGASIALIGYSYLGSINSTISSIEANTSTVDIDCDTIEESITGNAKSKIVSLNTSNILGQNLNRYDIFLSNSSIFKAGNLKLNA